MSAPLPFRRKVLGVGLGRTGTASLAAALDRLGIPARHHVTYDGGLDGASRETACRAVLARYQGIANGTALPIRRLDRAYPGSKFVLTVRDEESWLTSKRRYAERELAKWDTYSPEHRERKRALREEIYGSFEFDPDRWLAAYRHRCDSVRRYFADRPEDLLVLDIPGGDGWEPLCSFLGADVPEEPFPRRNTWRELDAWARRAESFWHQVDRIVGPGEVVLLVDDGRLPADGRAVRRFNERNGEYQGTPRDEAVILSELEGLRDLGGRRVVFAWDALWWLDEYPGLRAWLEERAAVEARTEELLCYRLAGPAPRRPVRTRTPGRRPRPDGPGAAAPPGRAAGDPDGGREDR